MWMDFQLQCLATVSKHFSEQLAVVVRRCVPNSSTQMSVFVPMLFCYTIAPAWMLCR